jgi:hypothetical protein
VTRRRRPTRVGDILPDTAASLGLAEELRLARLMSTWTAIVAEHLPAAAGGSRVAGVEGRILLVEADHGLIGQEIRLRERDIVSALRATPGGGRIDRLRVRVGGRSADAPL